MKYLKFVAKHTWLFYLISFTWGFISSFIGLLMMIPFLVSGKVKTFNKRLYGVFPKSFGEGWGFSMGCFFFTSYDCYEDTYLRYHEMGHGLQNLIFGPLQLFIITIPSVIRFWYRDFKYERKGIAPVLDYEEIWFEELATNWGNYVYGNIKIPTKYSYLVINQKTYEDRIEYRRVLISYKGKKVDGQIVRYTGTKIIDADSYFKNKDATIKYFFMDKYYYIDKVSQEQCEMCKSLVHKKRKYHYYINCKLPIEFRVCSNQEAKRYLQNIK